MVPLASLDGEQEVCAIALDQFIAAVVGFAKALEDSRLRAFVGSIKIGRDFCVLSLKQAVASKIALDNEGATVFSLQSKRAGFREGPAKTLNQDYQPSRGHGCRKQ